MSVLDTDNYLLTKIFEKGDKFLFEIVEKDGVE